MFIGTGERIDHLEQFSPTRFVGRMLGMGDIKALLEMARGLELQADENQAKRLLSGKMTIEDFYAQMDNVGKMGFRNYWIICQDCQEWSKKIKSMPYKPRLKNGE